MAQEESAGSARDGTHRPRSFVHQDSDEHSPDTGADQLPAVIARLPKNADEEVRVTLDEYRASLPISRLPTSRCRRKRASLSGWGSFPT